MFRFAGLAIEFRVWRWQPPASGRFAVPRLYSAKGVTMADSLILVRGLTAHVPLNFANQDGVAMSPPTNGTVTSSDTAVATVTLAADGGSVTIASVADGQSTITYIGGTTTPPITFTLGLTVQDAAVSSGGFNTAGATFTTSAG